MSALTTLVGMESKLLRRDLAALFFGLAFPALLLLVLGNVFPGFLDPEPDLGGLRLIDVYTPIMLLLALVMVGIGTMPVTLAAHRERGVLRRMRTTPLPPSRLLLAQLIVYLSTALLASALAILAGIIAFDMVLPQDWPGFVLAFVLAAVSVFSLGLLVGAVVSSASAAQSISLAVWMPLMVLGGLWFPREAMPDSMLRISDLTPTGAGVQAIQDAWTGAGAAGGDLAVMAVWAAVAGAAAARWFRWE